MYDARNVGTDAERKQLETKVVGLACCQFGCSALSILVFGGLFMSVIGVIRSEGDIMQKCDQNPDYNWFCQPLQQERDSFCQTMEENNPDLSDRECHKDFANSLRDGVSTLQTFTVIIVLIGLCCSGCVPACGCAGAKQNNRGLLICFMIMNVLTVISNAYSLLSYQFLFSGAARVLGMGMVCVCSLVPILSVVFSWQLQERMGRTVMTAPPHSVPMMVASPVQPATAQPGQYPQAMQVQPMQVTTGQYVGPPATAPHSGA